MDNEAAPQNKKTAKHKNKRKRKVLFFQNQPKIYILLKNKTSNKKF